MLFAVAVLCGVMIVLSLFVASGERPERWSTLWTLWTLPNDTSKSIQSVQKGPTAVGINFGERPLQKFFTRKLIVTKKREVYSLKPLF
jgi:hypothetical protein